MFWIPIALGILLAAAGAEAAAQSGITVVVPELAKVRVGPGTVYDQIGELTKGQTAIASGRTQSNDWVQIEFAGAPDGKGWVFAALIRLQGGTIDQLPLASTPPTATLPPTPPGQGDPLSATAAPVRLPTYTPPAPATPRYFVNTTPDLVGFPAAIIIISLTFMGVIGAVIAFFRRSAR